MGAAVTNTRDSIRNALAHVPAHDHAMWVRMGMAVKSELGEDGFDLWDEWSQRDDSYSTSAARSTWHSFKAGGKVTIATLFHEAKRHGYRGNGHARAPVPTQAEREERERQERQAEAREVEKRAAAAKVAADVFKVALPARADHPYLVRKHVPPVVTLRELPASELARLVGYAVKSGDESLAGRVLIAAIRDGDVISSLEFIDEAGSKSALAGGAKSGGYWSAQRMPEGDGEGLTLHLCEGVATTITAHVAADAPAFAALSCHNLPKAARALRARYPRAAIIVCGELGHTARYAHEAAQAVAGTVAFPAFADAGPHDGADLNDLAEAEGMDAVKRALASARTPEVSEPQPDAPSAPAGDSGGVAWPELHPLMREGDDEPYPLAALPDGIREAVGEVVAFVQCPPALAACSALSALSIVGQGMANVRRAPSLEGPTSLYVMAVAESGERKTACDSHFLTPIRDWTAEQAKAWEPELKRYQAKHGAWQATCDGIKARIRELSKGGKPTVAAEQELVDAEAECPLPLRVPRLLYGDTTPEALGVNLAKGWPCGGIMSSEAGVVFGGHGMGSESVMRQLSLLNSLWDGASIPVDRKTAGSFALRGHERLTMGLAAQHETVRQFMEGTKGLARGNGFAARFLIAAPKSTQGYRPFRYAESWAARDAFTGRLRAMLAALPTPDDDGRLSLPMLELEPDAAAIWQAFYNEVEAQLRPSGELATVRDVASKAPDNVARVAAQFHLYAHGASGRVSGETMRSACVIVTWHLFQARAFLNDVAEPRERANARRVEAWLWDCCRRESVDVVERRRLQNAGPIRNGTTLDAALAELEALGRVRQENPGKRRLVRVRAEVLEAAHGPS